MLNLDKFTWTWTAVSSAEIGGKTAWLLISKIGFSESFISWANFFTCLLDGSGIFGDLTTIPSKPFVLDGCDFDEKPLANKLKR